MSCAIIYKAMANLTSPTEVQLGPQGRLVIPAQLRRLLGFKPGDRLVARLEDGRLILEKRETIRRRLQDRFARLPAGESLGPDCWPSAVETPNGRRPLNAVLAYLRDESGSETIPYWMSPRFRASGPRWCRDPIAGGVEIDGLRDDMEALGLSILPFTPEEAETAGRLWLETRSCGLSLGDRPCLSLSLSTSFHKYGHVLIRPPFSGAGFRNTRFASLRAER